MSHCFRNLTPGPNVAARDRTGRGPADEQERKGGLPVDVRLPRPGAQSGARRMVVVRSLGRRHSKKLYLRAIRGQGSIKQKRSLAPNLKSRMLNRVMPILKFISINRAVLLASIAGISSIYAAPHEAQKPADNSRHLRILQTSTSSVHTEFSGTLGIAELQKRFHPGGWSTKDPGQNDGPVFWLSTATDSGSWKDNIVATTFWIGEPSSSGNRRLSSLFKVRNTLSTSVSWI